MAADHYGLLFYYPQRNAAVGRIWSEPGNVSDLEELVKDSTAPAKVRFLAAEVLFARDVFFVDRAGEALVAQLYADALVNGYTGHANAWGLLWEHDEVGEVGSRFLVLGEAAIPALSALLDNDTIVDSYEGSEEATVGNGYRFRIKDFAAYYLNRITGYPVPFHRDHGGRDAEIERLKAHLKAAAR